MTQKKNKEQYEQQEQQVQQLSFICLLLTNLIENGNTGYIVVL